MRIHIVNVTGHPPLPLDNETGKRRGKASGKTSEEEHTREGLLTQH